MYHQDIVNTFSDVSSFFKQIFPKKTSLINIVSIKRFNFTAVIDKCVIRDPLIRNITRLTCPICRRIYEYTDEYTDEYTNIQQTTMKSFMQRYEKKTRNESMIMEYSWNTLWLKETLLLYERFLLLPHLFSASRLLHMS